MFKQILFLSVLALGFSENAKAQIFDTGMVFAEEEEYAKLPERRRTRGVVMFDKIDLSSSFPPAVNQGPQPSCGSWAVGYGARSYYMTANASDALAPEDAVSPAFIFNLTNPAAFSDEANCGGVTLTSTLEFLKTKGALKLADWPYDPKTCKPNSPSEEDIQKASFNKIPDYSAFNIEQIKEVRRYKEVLATGQPIIVAMNINIDEYMQYKGGVYEADFSKDVKTGGHGMVVVGFDDERQAFLLFNSWGEDWGEDGKMWISYDTFIQQIREAYVIEGLEAPNSVFLASVSGASAVNPFTKKPVQPLIDEPSAVIVEPESLTEEALTIEERVSNLLMINDDIRCGGIEVLNEEEIMTVSGFAGPVEVDEVIASLSALEPDAILEIQEMPWPACEAADIVFENIDNQNIELGVYNLDIPELLPDGVSRLENGNQFVIRATAPKEWKALQIFYLQADQTAKEIFRDVRDKGEEELWEISIGDMVASLRASQPFGAEAVILLAGDELIINEKAGVNLAEFEFLKNLQKGVQSLEEKGGAYSASLRNVQVIEKLEAVKKGGDLITVSEYQSMRTPTGLLLPDVDKISGVSDLAKLGFENTGQGFSFLKGNIDLKSTQFYFRAETGLIDISDRFHAFAVEDDTHIQMKDFNLVAGKHRFRLVLDVEPETDAVIEFSLDNKHE